MKKTINALVFATVFGVAGMASAVTETTMDVTSLTNIYDSNNIQIGTLSYSVTGGNSQNLDWSFKELSGYTGDALSLSFSYSFQDKVGGNTYVPASSTFNVSTLNDGDNAGSFNISPDQLIKINSVTLKYIQAAAPVPEPESYAMLLAGLGIMGVVARRRQKQA